MTGASRFLIGLAAGQDAGRADGELHRVDIGRGGVTARRIRILMKRAPGYGVGLRETRVLRERGR